MKSLFFIAIYFIVISCGKQSIFNNKDVYKNKLEIKTVNDSNFVIEKTGKNFGRLECSITNETTKYISGEGESILFDFYIISPYLNGAYFYNYDNADYLIFENNIPGASGIAANITEVTMIKFINNKISFKVSFSSFCGGASLLKFAKNAITLNVFNYVGEDSELNDKFCRTEFILIDGVFQKLENSESFQYKYGKQNTLLPNYQVRCSGLTSPYVTRHKS